MNQLTYRKESFMDQMPFKEDASRDRMPFEEDASWDRMPFEKNASWDRMPFEKDAFKDQKMFKEDAFRDQMLYKEDSPASIGMPVLQTEKRRAGLPDSLRIPVHYLAGAAFVLLFALIYDQFSHGVHSIYMDAAFLIPAAGALISFLLSRRTPAACARPSGRAALIAGILTLTVGSLVQGIFLIAGTASPYMLFYPVAGFALTAGGILLWRPRRSSDSN